MMWNRTLQDVKGMRDRESLIKDGHYHGLVLLTLNQYFSVHWIPSAEKGGRAQPFKGCTLEGRETQHIKMGFCWLHVCIFPEGRGLSRGRKENRETVNCVEMNKQNTIYSILFRSALGDFGSLDGCHFLKPALSGLGLLDGAKIVGRETGDTHVVITLQDKLNVTYLECWRRTQLGETTGLSDDVVDEIICHLEDELESARICCQLSFVRLLDEGGDRCK